MKKLKSLILVALSVAMIGVFTGCTNNNVSKEDNQDVRTVTTLKGDIEIPTSPKRIVDISGSSEELVILGHTPVATANVDSYETDKVASYVTDKLGSATVVGHSMMDTMDTEAILAANPDLIIMSERQQKIYDELVKIAPVVMMKDYANDWRDKLIDVAKLFDQEEDADKWLNSYDEKAKKLGEEVKAVNGDQTYLTVLASSGQFMVFTDAGIGTIVNDDMGFRRPENLPAQEGITLPVLTMEGLTEIDADHIVLIGTESDKADLANSTVWPNIRAVKEGNVTVLDASPFFSQSYNPIGKELLLESIRDELIK